MIILKYLLHVITVMMQITDSPPQLSTKLTNNGLQENINTFEKVSCQI